MEPTLTQLAAANAHPDVQAIIARPPARLTRWGNTVLLLIVASVLASTVFIRYAERLSVPLQLGAGVPPVPVLLAPGAVLGQLCVQPRQLVARGQVLGYATEGAGAAHAVRAPAAGLVSYGAVAALGAPAREGTAPSLYILPVVRPGTEVGNVRITQRQLRYLHEGQPVEVSFEAYPAGEYGTVRGQLAQIADLPDAEGGYRALVTFPHGLQTTAGQRLTFRAGMNATAELVVAYRPLLQQLFPGIFGSS
jgi:hypothetical protein